MDFLQLVASAQYFRY